MDPMRDTVAELEKRVAELEKAAHKHDGTDKKVGK